MIGVRSSSSSPSQLLLFFALLLYSPFLSHSFISSFFSRAAGSNGAAGAGIIRGGGNENLPNVLGSQRGISVDSLQKYSESTFSCDGVSIPIQKVNDNFCDCFDGSDEPGTSACQSGRFTCKNDGFQSHQIPSSRVDDGICDCCDGSDESSSLCENECDAAAAAQRKALEQFRNGYLIGSKIKKEKIEQMKLKIQNSRVTLDVLAPQLSEVQMKLEQARQDLEHQRKIETEEIAQIVNGFSHQINSFLNLEKLTEEKLSPLLTVLFSLLDVIEEDIHEILQSKSLLPSPSSSQSAPASNDERAPTDFGDHVEDPYGDYDEEFVPPHSEEGEETISLDTASSEGEVISYDDKNCPLLKFSSDDRLHILCPLYSKESNPLRSLHQFLIQFIITRKPLKEIQLVMGYEFISGTYEGAKEFFHRILATTLPAENEQGQQHDYCPLEFEKHPELCLLADRLNTLFLSGDVEQYSRPEVQEANELIQQLTTQQNELNKLKRESENLINESSNYDDQLLDLLNLKGECFDRVDGAFTYTVCLGTKVTQKENGRGNAGVNLGTFSDPKSSIVMDEAIDGLTGKRIPVMKLLYSNGQHCHAFGARKAEVLVTCGEKTQLLDATEPSTCAYSFEMESPIACSEEYAKAYGFDNN
jgi:hypothetical protein